MASRYSVPGLKKSYIKPLSHVKIWAQLDYKFTNYSYLSEATVANFQNNRKIWISCVHKGIAFWGKKILFKQSNGLIRVIWTAPSETTVKRWYADFKCSHTGTNDAEHSGHPNLAVVLNNIKKLH